MVFLLCAFGIWALTWLLKVVDVLICLIQGRWVHRECFAKVTQDVEKEGNVVLEVIGDPFV
jgi:hypothetical protein